MPRGKKKGGRRKENGKNPAAGSDDEGDGTPDNMSTASALSDGSTVLMADVGGEEAAAEVDESSTQELFEEKLKDVIDALTQKSAKGRTDALKNLHSALAKRYIPEFVLNRKMTISDNVERCLKKGKGEEQSHAAYCSVLLMLQLGGGADSHDVLKQFAQPLKVIMTDASASVKARTACAVALGISNFIAGEEMEEILEAMKSLESVFRMSYLKGDGNTRSLTPETAQLHNAALTSWTLLLSIVPPSIARNYVSSHLSKMQEILLSGDVDLRITSGETIALMYELAREADEDFEGDDFEGLCETLKELATDSNKFRAKKDRRQQRSSFRDILGTVEKGDWPRDRIKFNTMESLLIDSWVRKKQYDGFAYMLGSGTNIQLTENELLRDIFGLGAPIPTGLPTNKASKNERHMFNAAAFKARTKARGKFRDKRSAAVHDS